MKLSVVISAFNEEKKIRECLESVKWADEIIFVDNSSTDSTSEIANKYTSKIFTRKNNLMLNINKNFGFTKATGEWILNLDADEHITPELKEEIFSTLSGNAGQLSTANGYYIPRKNIIFGKWIKHAGWYPDHQLRLFKNGKGRFEKKHVHELIKIDGKTEYLKENLVHYNFETISQFLHKHIDIYAPNEADQLLQNSYELNWADAIRFPSKEFISRFFAREGYKEGLHGLVISMLMAFYHLVIFTRIWEIKCFEEYNTNRFLENIKDEAKKTGKEFSYWFWLEKFKKMKNPAQKITYKLLRKTKIIS